MEQTAVEWFYDKIKSHFDHDGDLLETLIFTMEQAKEMEKQQIVDSFEKGYENGAGVSDEDAIYHGGNYYNKTFKSE